jgi:hypothetical protein
MVDFHLAAYHYCSLSPTPEVHGSEKSATNLSESPIDRSARLPGPRNQTRHTCVARGAVAAIGESNTPRRMPRNDWICAVAFFVFSRGWAERDITLLGDFRGTAITWKRSDNATSAGQLCMTC